MFLRIRQTFARKNIPEGRSAILCTCHFREGEIHASTLRHDARVQPLSDVHSTK